MISLQLLSVVASQTLFYASSSSSLSLRVWIDILPLASVHLSLATCHTTASRCLSSVSEELRATRKEGVECQGECHRRTRDTSAAVCVFVCLPLQGGAGRHCGAGRPHAHAPAHAASRHDLLHELLVVRNGEHGAFEILERAHKPVEGLFILSVSWSATKKEDEHLGALADGAHSRGRTDAIAPGSWSARRGR